MWIELESVDDRKPLHIDTNEIVVVEVAANQCILYTRSRDQFRVTQGIESIRQLFRKPTFVTVEGVKLEVNLKLVRTAYLMGQVNELWHYQLKFADDGYLEVLSDMPIKL